MKLHKVYGTDPTLETEGVWVNFGDGGEVKVGRYGNPKHKAALERLRRPYRSFELSGRPLPDDVAERIMLEGLAEGIVFEWRGIEDESGLIQFSKQNVIKTLSRVEFRDFRNDILAASMSMETFRKQELEDAAKNSGNTSAGNIDTAVVEKSTPIG